MNKTRVTQILKIDYPIVQGGMLWLADAGLAAAVSNSGGLGVISPMAGMEPHGDPVENLNRQLERAATLTEKPIGMNIPLDLRDVELLIDTVLAHRVPAVITAAGDPRLYTDLLRSAGAVVIHVVSCVKHAVLAEKAGVDMIVASGVEAAARNGFDELPLFALLPQVVDAVSIPVIAAGGIVEARGLAAAYALGAEGVQLGTAFVAVTENIASQKYKEAIVSAIDTDTLITNRGLIPSRRLKNTAFSQALLALEKAGASAEEIEDFMGYAPSRRAGLEGSLDEGEAYCGAAAGLIPSITTVAEVINRLTAHYPGIVERLRSRI